MENIMSIEDRNYKPQQVQYYYYEKWSDLQLGFWIVIITCNFILIQHIFTTWMLLNKLHEL
jgi:hypothetical protein